MKRTATSENLPEVVQDASPEALVDNEICQNLILTMRDIGYDFVKFILVYPFLGLTIPNKLLDRIVADKDTANISGAVLESGIWMYMMYWAISNQGLNPEERGVSIFIFLFMIVVNIWIQIEVRNCIHFTPRKEYGSVIKQLFAVIKQLFVSIFLNFIHAAGEFVLGSSIRYLRNRYAIVKQNRVQKLIEDRKKEE